MTAQADLFRERGAELSQDKEFRYRLWRTWGKGKRVNFVMLNPSTADASEDDPTIRRCIGFARAWGFDGLVVTNLYALRATDPAALKEHDAPVGIGNDLFLITTAEKAGLIVAAWGNHGVGSRGEEVAIMLRREGDVKCFGLTRKDQPRHPLYLGKDTELIPF